MEFGTGDAGKRARVIMESGEPCVECEGPADHTLDFDVRGDLTQLAVCCGCDPIVMAKVAADLKKIGQIDTVNTFGRNGNGRS